MVKSRRSAMASTAADHPLEQARVVGGGKPKKNSLAHGRNIRTLEETRKKELTSTTQGIDFNCDRGITRGYLAQLKAQVAAAAEIIDLGSSEDELRQGKRSSFGFEKLVHQKAHVDVIELDSSEDEKSQFVNGKFCYGGVVQSTKQIDVIELESSEDEQSPKESVGNHDPKHSLSMEETADSQSNEVESAINTEAYEVENLQAQSEMTSHIEMEPVILEPLHARKLTAALREQVLVDEHAVFDYNDYATEGRAEFSLGSVSDITYEDRDNPRIGVADNIGEVKVELKYEEVDQEDEAPVDFYDLDEKGQLEIRAMGSIVIDLDQEYEKLCGHLQAQSEMLTCVEVEFVTLGALHYDNLSALKEGISDGRTEYVSCGYTIDSVSDNAASEESEQLEIGAADSIREVKVAVKYKADDQQHEAPVDIEAGQVQTVEALEDKGEPETEFKASMVNVMGVSLVISILISVLIGSTAFSYVKKGNSSTLTLAISICQQSLLTKKLNASPDVACSTAHFFQHIPSSWNCTKEPWDSKLRSFQKSSSYHLKGLQTLLEDEVQEKRDATESVCQQQLLTKNLNASSIVPVSSMHKLHSGISSLWNISLYKILGWNDSYEAERQEKSSWGRTFDESPWLQLTFQWTYLYRSFTTIEKSMIKNGHGDDKFIAPQWPHCVYGSFTTHRHGLAIFMGVLQHMPYTRSRMDTDVDESVAPQPYHLYGNFTSDEKIPITNALQ